MNVIIVLLPLDFELEEIQRATLDKSNDILTSLRPMQSASVSWKRLLSLDGDPENSVRATLLPRCYHTFRANCPCASHRISGKIFLWP